MKSATKKHQKRSRPSENAIVEATCEYLLQRGFKELRFEVPMGEKYLDIMARHQHEYCAIEAKVDSPTRAFKQATRYQHVAQRTYVALFGTASATGTHLADSTGIGLILVSPISPGQLTARIAVEARLSPYFEPSLASFIWQTEVD